MYSKDEISTPFKSVVNPALEEFGAELKERRWKIEDIQIHDPAYRWIDNTLTSKIQATKKKRSCASHIKFWQNHLPRALQVVTF